MIILACSKVRMVPILGYDVELAVKVFRARECVLWAPKNFLTVLLAFLIAVACRR